MRHDITSRLRCTLFIFFTVAALCADLSAQRTVLLFVVDGLESDAAKTSMAHGADNFRYIHEHGAWAAESFCTSPSPVVELPDSSRPWGTAAPPNIAMHTGTHVFESRKIDDVFLAARRAHIRSVFSGSADNYKALNTADFCYAVTYTDSIAIAFAIDHFLHDGARLLSVHVQNLRTQWKGPEDRLLPGSPYQNALLAADRLLGRLIDTIRSAGAWDSTYVILASDHGMGRTSRSEHPASLISSWQPYMCFFGPGIKRNATIPYAETPDIALFIAHVLRIGPLKGHLDPFVGSGVTGTLLTDLFIAGPSDPHHPRLIRQYLEGKQWKPADEFGEYRAAMLSLLQNGSITK